MTPDDGTGRLSVMDDDVALGGERTFAGPAEPDAQALIEEARRRQRRRYRWMGLLVAIVVLLGLVAVFIGGGGAGHRPSPTLHHARGRAGSSLHSTAPTGVSGTTVLSIGRAGPDVGWALNVRHLYITGDGGRTWRTVTPLGLADQSLADRVAAVTGVGTESLWIAADDVIGLVPPGQSVDGSDRGEEILRSTDGGTTWISSILPGCLQACGGNMSISFIDSLHGFVSDGRHLFTTSDGGATWSVVPSPSFAGGSITFTTGLDGWAEPDGGVVDTADPGSVLSRSTDGGRTWAPAPGLPADGEYQLPTFFTTDDGVLFGLVPSPVVFVTSDGGASWRQSPIPVTGSGASLRPPPSFSAPSPRDWFLSWGRSLVESTDGGGVWQTLDTKASWPADPGPGPTKGGAWGLAFLSADDGWAVVGVPPCKAPYGCDGEGLISTRDKGHTWRYLSP